MQIASGRKGTAQHPHMLWSTQCVSDASRCNDAATCKPVRVIVYSHVL